MHRQTNSSELLIVKNIRTWLYSFASAFPCLTIEKQPKEKKLFKGRINFLAAFPIGAILAIKRKGFKCGDKKVNNG